MAINHFFVVAADKDEAGKNIRCIIRSHSGSKDGARNLKLQSN